MGAYKVLSILDLHPVLVWEQRASTLYSKFLLLNPLIWHNCLLRIMSGSLSSDSLLLRTDPCSHPDWARGNYHSHHSCREIFKLPTVLTANPLLGRLEDLYWTSIQSRVLAPFISSRAFSNFSSVKGTWSSARDSAETWGKLSTKKKHHWQPVHHLGHTYRSWGLGQA